MSTSYCADGHVSKFPCLAPLYTLLDVNLSMGDLEFCQREIDMQLEIYSNKAQFVAMRLMLVGDFLHQNRDLGVVIFCNSWKQSQHYTVHFEKKLDPVKLTIDVVNIIGSLVNIVKFWWIRLFCDDRRSCQGRFCALATMNASNSVKGQFDLTLYVYLMSQLLITSLHDNDTSPSGCNGVEGFNLAISPCRNRTQVNTEKTYPLEPTERSSLCACTKSEMQEVICYFCFYLSCQHARGKAYLCQR